MGPYYGYRYHQRSAEKPLPQDQKPISLDYLGDDAILGKIENEAPELDRVDMTGLELAYAADVFGAASLGRELKPRRVPRKRKAQHEISYAEFLFLVRHKPGLLYAKEGENVVVLVRDNLVRQAAVEAQARYANECSA